MVKKDRLRRPTIIIADTFNSTFEKVSKIKKDFDLINLSSDFAVKFIIQREIVDMVILSKRILDIEGILQIASKRGIKVYQIGKDISESLEASELEDFFKKHLVYDEKAEEKPAVIDFLKVLQKKVRIEPENRSISSSKRKYKTDNPIKPGNALKIEKQLAPRHLEKVLPGAENRSIDKNDHRPAVSLNVRTIRQKTILFLKAKGGVGSTMLSIFLGYNFCNLKTLLIDMNFCEGGSDLGYYLDLPKTPNMTSFFEDYSYSSLADAVFNIKQGFDILQPPPSYNLFNKIDLQDIYELIDVAKKKYHIILFDLPNLLNELTIGILDIGDVVVMITDCSSGSIGRLINIDKKFLADDLEKVIVVNRSRRKDMKDLHGLLTGSIKNIIKYQVIDTIEGLEDSSPFQIDIPSIPSLNDFSGNILDILASD